MGMEVQEMNREKFSNLLIKLRRESNLTQKEFAKMFDVTFQAVSKWEKGESLPDIITLENISDYYHISINNLLDGNYIPQEEKKQNDIVKEEKIIVQPPVETKFKINIIKIIWCSFLLISLFILALFPFVYIEIDYEEVFINFYTICFSKDFRIGNFIALLSFLLFIAQNVLGIFASVVKRNKVLLLLEETFSIFFLLTTMDLLLSYIEIATSGSLFLAVLSIISYFALVLFKKLNYKANLGNHLQLQLDRASFLITGMFLFIIFCISVPDKFQLIPYAVICGAYFIITIVFYCILFFKQKSIICTILYNIFFLLTFSSLFITPLFLSYEPECKFVLFLTIFNLMFEIVRNIRNKIAISSKK